MISDDQKLALQKELAALDAAVKRETSGGQIALGNREVDVKESLGMGAINVDLLKALLGRDESINGQSLDWAKFDWDTNPFNPQNSYPD